MDKFLPEGYEVPKTIGNYMKFEDGQNKFRVLSSAVIGYEYFKTDNKPVRSKTVFEEMPNDIKKGGTIKPFWAFCVYNYKDVRIQILEITQKTIMAQIKAYVDNDAWGDPKKYDFVVTKTGAGIDTEYATVANPHSEISPEIVDKYKAKQIDLTALYEGLDPFKVDKE